LNKTEQVNVPKLRFLGEQDGAPERLLKQKLSDLFRRDCRVRRAYLTRVRLGESTKTSVLLAVRTESDADKNLVDGAAGVFAAIFSADESLDILFLNEGQEITLRRVCMPFCERGELDAGSIERGVLRTQ
jgi:hypothetical protein